MSRDYRAFGVLVASGLLLPVASFATPFYNVTVLGPQYLGAPDAVATAFNSAGQITGQYSDNGNAHAFLYGSGGLLDLGTLGGPSSIGLAINDNGQVAGDSSITGSTNLEATTHAFLYSNGNMQDLGTLGGAESHVAGVNNAGQVVGSSATANNTEHAFLFSNGVMQDLGTLPGAYYSYGYGINDAGQVTGVSFNYPPYPSVPSQAFIYSDGMMIGLGTLGGTTSEGIGISDNGLVTGGSMTAGNSAEHAFLYSNGKMQDLGTLGGTFSTGYGVNDAGQVIGESITNRGAADAFFYSDGSMYDLNNLIGAASSCVEIPFAFSINNIGQIFAVGSYAKAGSTSRAFILTPTDTPSSGNICAVSEPGVLGLMSFGLTGLGLAMRQRKR